MTTNISQVLELETLDSNLFRNLHHRENFMGTLFGGQVLAQALMACYRTVDEAGILPHSLHAYFLRAGKSSDPVIYDVEKVRDGKSVKSRRAVARQYGQSIFNMSASFHVQEDGFFHQAPFPAGIAMPEELLETRCALPHDYHIPPVKNADATFNPFEILPVEDQQFLTSSSAPAEAHFWMRAKEQLDDKPIVHYCTLAFASDLGLLATSLMPHGVSIFSGEILAASIDHAIWFHSSDFRADDWLLCKTHSPWAGGGRGFAHGSVYTRDGKLVLSTSQEGLIRPIKN